MRPHAPARILLHPLYPDNDRLGICSRCRKPVHVYDGSWKHIRGGLNY